MSDGSEVESLDAPPQVSPEVRARILSDPNVAKIAAELEMDLETYVNTIGFYLNNPGVEPGILVVSDANLRKIGVEPPSAEAIEANVRASVEAIKAGQGPSGFDAAKKKPVDMPSEGGEAVKPKVDPELEESIRKARSPKGS